jgi:hypothetical protein
MRKLPARLALTALAVAAVAVPALASAGSSNAADTSSVVRRDDSVAVIRQVTAKYHDINVALHDGYVPASECTASPAGAMGVHYLNPELAGQPVDLRHPAILLYLPTEDGPQLLGVEYFKADADQNLGTDSDRPSLLGHAFDGPMPGHNPVMPIHYDLHVWVWDHNPSGMFSQWNPTVSC